MSTGNGPPAREPADRPAPVIYQVRPRKMIILAGIAAFVVVGVSVLAGLLLKDVNEGVTFRTFDQVGLIGIGVVLAAAIMTTARPRLRATGAGLWVRNMLGDKFFPWGLIIRVAYPPNAPWAQLQLPDDEIHPVMAIQALDRGRAVRALEEVRRLHDTYAPPESRPHPMAVTVDDAAYARPLGRLEKIDLEKAAAHRRDLRAKAEKRARKAARRHRSA
jgi:Bacterial PH domain